MDFDAASQKDQPYYPSNLLVEERIDISPSGFPMAAESVLPDRAVGNQLSVPRQLSGLPLSIQEVKDEISRQIHLRHSAYYGSEAVIRRVAAFLTGGELTIAEQAIVPSPWWTSDGFWEIVCAVNIALGIMMARLEPLPTGLLTSIAAYFFVFCMATFIFVGIPRLFYLVIRLIGRQLASRLGR